MPDITQPVTYPGGTQWAVRWAQCGQEPRIHEIGCESLARSTRDYVAQRRIDLNMDTPEPELLSAHITWQVVE